MQYIQLQPQIASQVPIPDNGNLNFFLDIDDNYIKVKTSNDDVISSAVPYLTGGTYSDGTITFINNSGGTYTITGFTDTYLTGGTYSNGTITLINNTGSEIEITGITSSGGTTVISLTYSELLDNITNNLLITGSYYIITDFKTCYDVPEYYVNGNAKAAGVIDYVQGTIQPIIVLATGTNTISSSAYQTEYPKDRIQYDWTFISTPNGGDAYGRISERIDEYNNRTDYDHRNISFNRFRSYNKGVKLTGVIDSYDSSTGVITGNGTLFLSEVEIGDILFFDYQGYTVGVKVTSGSTDTLIFVVVDPSFGSQINFTGGLIPFYIATSTGNYNDYKEVYVGQKLQGDWDNFQTFNLNGSAIHNYVGDYSKFYLEGIGSNSGFYLANNVFYGNRTYSNTIGDRSYNNTGTYWFSRNTIAGRFYNNTIHQNGFYSNSIGEYFYNNIIKSSVYENTIEQNFYNNKIYSQFYANQIGKNFIENAIYSSFYENKIELNFGENIVGDLGNLSNFGFNRNRIGNNFDSNKVRQEFYNNQIVNEFNNNTVNGNFYDNVIESEFNYNQNIGYNFYGNHIGNRFNNNELIGDNFYNNKIGEYFYSNSISNYFNNNQINNNFENNTLGDTQYFNWDNTSIENLTGRTYNTLYNSLDSQIGNVILGKELIMRFYRDSGTTLTNGYLVVGETYEITNVAFSGGDFSNVANVIDGIINEVGCIFISTGTQPSSWCGITVTELTVYNEYHKVKFNQWTQNANGGGFSYERTKVYPSIESTVYFTKLNYEDKTDFIIPSRLEIARGNNDGIYNAATEGNWNGNGPQGTDWNSIYTQNNNGNGFQDNKINNQFKGNYIRNQFSLNDVKSYVSANQFSGDTNSNNIGNYTISNDFFGEVSGNIWIGDFYNNNITEYFYNNTISDNFYGNTIGNYFQWNNINASVSDTLLSSCVFYNSTTVNLFVNNSGNLRLSYFDDMDILTVESINEINCITSFTLSSTDFTSFSWGGGVIPNGTSGFTTDGFQNAGTSLYQSYNFVSSKGTDIQSLFITNRLLTNNTAYIFNVTWGVDSSISSGKVIMGFNGGHLFIAPIYTGDNNWQIPGQSNFSIASVAGTFNFPATFSLYSPITPQGTSWC